MGDETKNIYKSFCAQISLKSLVMLFPLWTFYITFCEYISNTRSERVWKSGRRIEIRWNFKGFIVAADEIKFY